MWSCIDKPESRTSSKSLTGLESEISEISSLRYRRTAAILSTAVSLIHLEWPRSFHCWVRVCLKTSSPWSQGSNSWDSAQPLWRLAGQVEGSIQNWCHLQTAGGQCHSFQWPSPGVWCTEKTALDLEHVRVSHDKSAEYDQRMLDWPWHVGISLLGMSGTNDEQVPATPISSGRLSRLLIPDTFGVKTAGGRKIMKQLRQLNLHS